MWIALAFSPDGKLLAGGEINGGVYFWNPSTGEQTGALPQHFDRAEGLSFSPDGKMLAVGERWTQISDLTLWDVASQKLLHRPSDNRGGGFAVAFGPASLDQPRLFSAGQTGNVVRLWDPIAGKELELADGHSSAVDTVAFLPDNKVLTVSLLEASYRLWDSATGKQLNKVSTGNKRITSAFPSPDGNLLAVRSYYPGLRPEDLPKSIHLFDVLAGKEIKLDSDVCTGPLAFTPDGTTLAAAEVPDLKEPRRIAIWNMKTGKVVRRFGLDKAMNSPPPGLLKIGPNTPLHISLAALSPDGKLLALRTV